MYPASLAKSRVHHERPSAYLSLASSICDAARMNRSLQLRVRRAGLGYALAALSCGAAVLLAPTEAQAANSTRDPFYVGGTILGFGAPLNSGLRGPGTTPYRFDFDFGYHTSGRHDGFVIGFRQIFLFGGGLDGGISQLRLGGDIPILIKGGRMEITIAPYGGVGIFYSFNGQDPRPAMSFGIEGKFFPIANNGFFAMARPFEITLLPGSGGVPALYGFGLGAGYAF